MGCDSSLMDCSKRAGYEHGYEFSLVDAAEIKSDYKKKLKWKAYLFEFRTKFVVKRLRTEEEEDVADDAVVVVLDTEKYDTHVYETGKEVACLHLKAGYRMYEYGMGREEIRNILKEAIDFAKEDPRKQQSLITAVVVSIEVATVQQVDESINACMDRAIRATNLVPLYLGPFATLEHMPITPSLSIYLHRLKRIRVENIDEGLALMQACTLCSRDTTIGAQISQLPSCNHAFHSHCIVRWLEDNNLCPTCQVPAYDRRIAMDFKRDVSPSRLIKKENFLSSQSKAMDRLIKNRENFLSSQS